MPSKSLAAVVVTLCLSAIVPAMAQSVASGKSDFQGDSRTSFKTPPKGTAVDVDADQIVFDDRNKTAIATGNVILTYGDYVLIARRVTYNQATDTMRAKILGVEPAELELDFPTVYDGAMGVAFIEAVVASSKSEQKWLPFQPGFEPCDQHCLARFFQ